MARRKKDNPSTTLGEPEPTEMADGMQAREEEQVRRRALLDRAESFLARRKDVQKVIRGKAGTGGPLTRPRQSQPDGRPSFRQRPSPPKIDRLLGRQKLEVAVMTSQSTARPRAPGGGG
jgi:hypothetical protein